MCNVMKKRLYKNGLQISGEKKVIAIFSQNLDLCKLRNTLNSTNFANDKNMIQELYNLQKLANLLSFQKIILVLM